MFATIDMSDDFTGFVLEAVKCLMTLHDTHSTNPNNSTSAPRVQLRFGCTCSKCLGGFISPRMKALLTSQASSFFDTLKDDAHGEYAFLSVLSRSLIMRMIHRALIAEGSYREGFRNICRHIRD